MIKAPLGERQWTDVAPVLDALLACDLPTAPHVATMLLDALDSDAQAVLEVTAQLTTAQRQGARALPMPLPLPKRVSHQYDAVEFNDEEIELLLVAGLCFDDDSEAVAHAVGMSVSTLSQSALGKHLSFDSGRASFDDHGLKSWVQRTADPAAHKKAHKRLTGAYQAAGNVVATRWHRSKAALHRDQINGRALVSHARELAAAGDVDAAFRIGAEAATHTSGAARDEAARLTGEAALGAGCVADASEWLSSLFPVGEEAQRAQSFGPLIAAQTFTSGAVPGVEVLVLHPRSDESAGSLTRAAALGAVLSAERGDRATMRAWLDQLQSVPAHGGCDESLIQQMRALCWVLSGECEATAGVDAGPLIGGIIDALRAAQAGDLDRALRCSAQLSVAASQPIDPILAGFERSPLLKAYRSVTETLLLFWRGDVKAARECLMTAATTAPIALPFAGLGVILARRLDIAVIGKLGPMSLSLTAVLPSNTRIDHLVDHGIESYLGGEVVEAAARGRLWLDRGAPGPRITVPGLDEITALQQADPGMSGRFEPPELKHFRSLCQRIRSADGRWQTDYAELSAESRQLRSPFGRGRVEALLGTACAIRGDDAGGRRHLRAARELFDDAGAEAWSAAVIQRLTRLGDDPSQSDSDPLAACRVAWEEVLTGRELEVAMLVAEGASNRVIAAQLFVSVRTIEVHIGRLLSKFGVRSRGELTALAYRTSQHL